MSWLFLLRSFFPKWVFFDDVAPELRLEVSVGEDWINALEPIPRSLRYLVVNPRGNFLHACHNHLNHFNADITDLNEATSRVEDLTTFKITRNLAAQQIRSRGLAAAPFRFRFRLLVVGAEGSAAEHVVLTSPVYEGS